MGKEPDMNIDRSLSLLDRVSLTGVDDKTSLADLVELSHRHPFVEWALLYVPHKEGAPRNPTKHWRKAFFDERMPGYSAVHLCGNLAFELLLKGELPAEIVQADRLQLNINARRREFSDDQVLDVYRRSLDIGPDIILQYHDDTAHLIAEFLAELATIDRARVHVLLDASKGTGKTPADWRIPLELEGMFCGHAGGLGPNNMEVALQRFESLGRRYWPDMETGIRTDNELDIGKVKHVLTTSQPFFGESQHARHRAEDATADAN